MFDEALAEDVLQEVWLAALEHAPSDVRSLRAWLAALVRNFAFKLHRKQARRDAREEASARAEAIPSAAQILERESVRKSVVEAVLALDEPYRSTLVLRYFEELSLVEIAKRLGVPRETVHTRLVRAHALLRARFDREHGGERLAWCLLLVRGVRVDPPAGVTVSLTLKTLLAGVIVMAVAHKIAVSASLVLLALTLLFLRSIASDAQAPANDVGAFDPLLVADSERATGAVAAESAQEPTRTVVASSEEAQVAVEPEPYGSLEVRVIWGDDKTPAEGAWVRALDEDYGSGSRRYGLKAKADSEGVIRFLRVRAGSVELYPDRGGDADAEVEPGKETTVVLEIDHLFDIEGEVVDELGNPVSGSEVWISDSEKSFAQGFHVATSDSRGAFRIRSVAEEYCSVAARARGHASSGWRDVRGGNGAVVHVPLRLLGRGGVVEGSVLDANGEPVNGAVVLVGSAEGEWLHFGGGLSCIANDEIDTCTDSDGCFRVEGIPPGVTPIAAQADDLAPWEGTVEVAPGATARVVIRMNRGIALAGAITYSNGEPAEGVYVDVRQHDDFVYTYTYTGHDGTFHFEQLPVGEIAVEADGDEYGSVEAILNSVVGDELVWNARLPHSKQDPEVLREIFGRVLDEADHPLAGYHVLALPDDGADPEPRSDPTDVEGRFTIRRCRDVEYELVAFRQGQSGEPSYEVARTRSVGSGSEETVIRVLRETLPSVYITGTVLDAHGDPIEEATVTSFRWLVGGGRPVSNQQTTITEIGTGRFRHGPYPPGQYSLRIRSSDHAFRYIEARELGANETWDLGEIRLEEGGEIVARLRREDAAPLGDYGVDIFGEDGVSQLSYIESDRNGVAHSELLPPGRYLLQLSSYGGDSAVCRTGPVEVRAGHVTEVEIPLRPGVQARIIFDDSGSSTPVRELSLSLRDDAGRQVWQRRVGGDKDGRFELEIHLAPGHYRLEATTDTTGRKASGELAISSDMTAPASFAFELH